MAVVHLLKILQLGRSWAFLEASYAYKLSSRQPASFGALVQSVCDSFYCLSVISWVHCKNLHLSLSRASYAIGWLLTPSQMCRHWCRPGPWNHYLNHFLQFLLFYHFKRESRPTSAYCSQLSWSSCDTTFSWFCLSARVWVTNAPCSTAIQSSFCASPSI